jgi:Tfp pilus assembly protein PilF
MTRLVAGLILAASLLVSTGAGASEQSERLYSRGLVDFHAGRYTQALALFQQAVDADPEDVYARYYRGVTSARLNDFAAAAADLRRVVAQQPNLAPAKLELGMALVQEHAYQEAVPWLEQAQQVAKLDAAASLFLGIAQLRMEQPDAARQQFQRAARDPQLRTAAQYYEGVVDYRQGRQAQAVEEFTQVARASPDSEIGRESLAHLGILQPAGQRAYQVHGGVGFEYDSNVKLLPSDQALNLPNAGQQEDERMVLTAGGTYIPWQNDRAQIALGYDFLQSLHFHLTDFNLQDQHLSAQGALAAGPLLLGAAATYDYNLRKDDSFLQEVNALPWMTLPEGGFGRTDVFYRMRWRDFFEQPFVQLFDGFNNSVGVRQVVYAGTPDRYASIGYRFDNEGPNHQAGNVFGYNGNEVSTSVGWLLPAAVSATAGYVYRHDSYDAASNGRRDNEHLVSVVGERPINEYLSVQLAYYGTFNNSNQRVFEYNRNIVSLSLLGRY